MDFSNTSIARFMGPAPVRATTPRGGVLAADILTSIATTFATSPTMIKVKEGVYCFAGGSIVNRTMIEAPEGLVIFDTGDDAEDGERALAEFRKISDKPIVAIIYSHNHYAHGTKPFLEGREGVQIIGHPLVNQHIEELASGFATGGDFPEAMPVLTARFLGQFGSLLPETGPDSGFAATIPVGKPKGTVLANTFVQDGQWLDVAGLKMQFFTEHFSDSEDTLTVWIPSLELALNNFLWSSLPNFYTLRGDVFRAPQSWRAGLRVLRDLEPTYLVNTHALPVVGKDKVAEALDGYMGAIGFMIDQTMRGINKGLGPDELREFVRLPKSLAACPYNAEVYGEFSYFPPHIYNHIFGWFDGDAARIHKLPSAEQARRIIAGFGGVERVSEQCEEALASGEVVWALQLADWLVQGAPGAASDKLKANALREFAYRAPGTIARQFALTQALALEGKINQPVAVQPTVNAILSADPGRYVNFQRVRLDPVKVGETVATLRVVIDDKARTFALVIRHGVAEFMADDAAKRLKADAELRLSHRAWAELYTGAATLAGGLDSGAIKADDRAAAERIWAWFDAPPVDAKA
ncbi:MAG: MBL fold metallo-hydrolase [Hyphomicrobiales bacterium]|nr:MBL fold metallo-hydrolase [Hyphomicrobiales bacterium]